MFTFRKFIRPPYLISTLDKAKDVTLQEIIKDASLREQLLKLKEQAMSGTRASDAKPIMHNNYSFELVSLHDIQESSEAIGYMLIVTTSQKNNIKSLYEQSLKNSRDLISLRLEDDDDLSSSIDKVLKFCREQFALSYEKMRDILSGRKDIEKDMNKVAKAHGDSPRQVVEKHSDCPIFCRSGRKYEQ